MAEKSGQHEAMWRGDPNETFSDWTIEIVSSKTTSNTQGNVSQAEEGSKIEEAVAMYHVHRNIMAYGERKGEYFVKLYRNSGNFWEFKTRTSRIELDQLAAGSFPRVLDYLYNYKDQLQVDTETATALNYMGDYFEIIALCNDSEAFCKKDICFQNVATYYEHCLAFQNETFLGIVWRSFWRTTY